jgi:hypothetical protein
MATRLDGPPPNFGVSSRSGFVSVKVGRGGSVQRFSIGRPDEMAARRGDVWWGLGYGLGMSLVYVAFFLALQFARLVAGAPARAAAYPPARAILAAYVAGGVGGGIVMGLLRPWLQHARYRWACGVLIAVPVSFSAAVALYGLPAGWARKEWATLVVMSVLFGIGGVQALGEAPSDDAAGPWWRLTRRPRRASTSRSERSPANNPYPPAAS